MAIRRRWVVLGAILVALVGGGFWGKGWLERQLERDRALIDPFADHPVKHEVLGPSHYFRFFFRGSFDGEPFVFEQLVECRPFRASAGIGGGVYRMYQRIPEVAQHRLKTGGALYFAVPHYCRADPSSKRWQEYWRSGETVGTIPLTFWADRAEDPNVIEAYVVPDYFTHPDARLRLDESGVTFLPRGFEPEKKPDIDPRLRRPGGRGWVLVPLPADKGEEALGERLAASPSGRLGAFLLDEDTQLINILPLGEYAKTLGHIPLNLPESLLISQEKEWVYRGQPIAGQLVPLLWDGETYKAAPNTPPGLVYLYPGNDVYVTFVRENPVVVFDDERITLPTREISPYKIALCDRRVGACYSIYMW